jgi:hypothetical protein
MASGYYFVIVGHGDNPLFELENSTKTSDKSDDKKSLNQFVAHAALDLVDEATWQTGNLYLKTVDKFNDSTVTGFVTASHMRFLLLHDGQSRGSDTIRNFFTDMYDAFVKAALNPFYVPNTPITSIHFKRKAQQIAKKHLN